MCDSRQPLNGADSVEALVSTGIDFSEAEAMVGCSTRRATKADCLHVREAFLKDEPGGYVPDCPVHGEGYWKLRDDLCPACGLTVEPGGIHPECARWP